MPSRTLGRSGAVVSAIGLGCMGMSGAYGAADRDESIATIHAALDAGVTLLDTADFYGSGHNELLIAQARKDRPHAEVALSMTFGGLRDPAGNPAGTDNRPVAVKNALAQTLVRLGVDHIDIYRPAGPDPNVPIEETVGAIAEMVRAGYVRHIGLADVSAETLRRAHAVHPIVDLQIEYSLFSRGIEDAILPACRELGVGVSAYGVLSRGLIGGNWKTRVDEGDFRSRNPRFQGENLDRNVQLVGALRPVAAAKDASVAQVAIAWVLHRGDDIVPLVGSRRRPQLASLLGALAVHLDAADMSAIEAAVPKNAAAGERYRE